MSERVCGREGCGKPCPPSKSRPFLYCSPEHRPSAVPGPPAMRPARTCFVSSCGTAVVGARLYCDAHRQVPRDRARAAQRERMAPLTGAPPRPEVSDPADLAERAKRLPELTAKIRAEAEAEAGARHKAERRAIAAAARSMVTVGRAVLKALGEAS